MGKTDIYQSIGGLPPDRVQRIIDRLEFRGRDPVFTSMREAYFDRLDLASRARILDLGCGTGFVARAIAKRAGFTGKIVGIDLASELIEAAKGFAADEGLADKIEFRAGDCQALEDPDDSFDAVIAHTLISHVNDPSALIASAARVAAPDCPIVMFDGDYSSMSFGAGDPEVNTQMVQGILDAIVANPYVMRQLTELLRGQGLEIVEFISDVYAEAGQGAFYANLAEAYVPMAVKAGTIAKEAGEQWLAAQRDAVAAGSFFGACNYYTYLAKKLA